MFEYLQVASMLALWQHSFLHLAALSFAGMQILEASKLWTHRSGLFPMQDYHGFALMQYVCYHYDVLISSLFVCGPGRSDTSAKPRLLGTEVSG